MTVFTHAESENGKSYQKPQTAVVPFALEESFLLTGGGSGQDIPDGGED